jgi:peptidylprolyl isomerase
VKLSPHTSPRPNRVPLRRLTRAGGALLAAGLLLPGTLAACSSKPSSSTTAVKGANTSVGVAVTGGFGQKPTLTVPNAPAPSKLTADVLSQGTGPALVDGETVVVNYLGETWATKDGKPNVFDNSYDRKQVLGFGLGTQGIISGWNKTLVGKTIGSRLLLTIPPAEGYGTAKDESQPLAGETLLFVVDVIGKYEKTATATGTPAGPLPAGFPQVKSASGAVPSVTSVKGLDLKATTPKSALLLKGTGPAIDSSKSLALQLLQVDAKTGKEGQSSWTSDGPQVIPASEVLPIVTALKGANVGSRAVVVAPATAQSAASVLVVDVVGQN